MKSRNGGRLWTETEAAILAALWGEKPSGEIAAILNRYPGCVRRKAARMGLPPISTEQQHAWRLASRKKGETHGQGAKEKLKITIIYPRDARHPG